MDHLVYRCVYELVPESNSVLLAYLRLLVAMLEFARGMLCTPQIKIKRGNFCKNILASE